VGGGDAIRLMCSRFYTHAFADATIAPFMFETDGAVVSAVGRWRMHGEQCHAHAMIHDGCVRGGPACVLSWGLALAPVLLSISESINAAHPKRDGYPCTRTNSHAHARTPPQAHGKRLGDWMVQKLGGEGSPWSDSGRHGMRQPSHQHAWHSHNRAPEDRGKRFKLSDCRVWMRLHFLACRETGLADHAAFMGYYVELIQHFVGVYERSAPMYAQESAEWSADPANVQRYLDDGCKMVDVLDR
jgi:hypothetical protein